MPADWYRQLALALTTSGLGHATLLAMGTVTSLAVDASLAADSGGEKQRPQRVSVIDSALNIKHAAADRPGEERREHEDLG